MTRPRDSFAKAATIQPVAGDWRLSAWPKALELAAGCGAWLGRLFELERERRRLFLWLPVGFGAGILLYFAADREPALWAPLLAAAACASAALAFRFRPRVYALLVLLAFVFAGFGAACLRTANVAAPILSRTMVGTLSGYVASIDERGAGLRLVVVPSSFSDLKPKQLPARVRVTLRKRAAIVPGDHIAATVRLLPPPEPGRPGGYDFARDAYFKGIGAVGSISGKLRHSPPPSSLGWMTSWRLRLEAGIDAGRGALTERIMSAFGGQAGALAAALVTGKRGQLTERTNEVLRSAGIYHIVSISGLHMVLAAGVFFWLSRAALAAVPGLALRWPIKKMAAVIAMVGATAYCIFTGSDVATERSLVMTLVLLGAILADRPALAMRNLAIAALIVLAMEPESLLGPSFQMSFAAVAGLIAFTERGQRVPGEVLERKPPAGLMARMTAASIAVVSTTLVAELTTGPYSAYHFQSLSPFGVLGNAMALPFLSLIVMPAAVIGVLAYPFGLDTPIWWTMGLASEPILLASHWIAAIPHARFGMPAIPLAAVAMMSAAILWFSLWSTTLRWFALVPALLGLGLALTPARPDVMVDRSGKGAAFRNAEGRLELLGKPSGFVVEQWLRADGDARATTDPSLRGGATCDSLACVGRVADGGAVSLVRDKRAFTEDCTRADIVISRHSAPATCQPALLIDGAALARRGAAHVYLGEGSFTTQTARADGARRPWLRPAPGAAKPQAAPSGPAMTGHLELSENDRLEIQKFHSQINIE